MILLFVTSFINFQVNFCSTIVFVLNVQFLTLWYRTYTVLICIAPISVHFPFLFEHDSYAILLYLYCTPYSYSRPLLIRAR